MIICTKSSFNLNNWSITESRSDSNVIQWTRFIKDWTRTSLSPYAFSIVSKTVFLFPKGRAPRGSAWPTSAPATSPCPRLRPPPPPPPPTTSPPPSSLKRPAPTSTAAAASGGRGARGSSRWCRGWKLRRTFTRLNCDDLCYCTFDQVPVRKYYLFAKRIRNWLFCDFVL